MLSTSDTISSIVKPLEPTYFTSKELAELLGVTSRTVNFEAADGNQNFREWSAKRGKGTYDFKITNPGSVRQVRQFFQVSEGRELCRLRHQPPDNLDVGRLGSVSYSLV